MEERLHYLERETNANATMILYRDSPTGVGLLFAYVVMDYSAAKVSDFLLIVGYLISISK